VSGINAATHRIALHRRRGRGPRPRLGLRLRVLLHRRRLDRELADGCPPEASPQRAVRAQQLAAPATGRELARYLRELVVRAERPRVGLLDPTVPVVRDVVLPRREALLGLAERLEQPVPLNPCGVARVLLLLSDGAGPLYSRASVRTMTQVLFSIADGMQPYPDSQQ